MNKSYIKRYHQKYYRENLEKFYRGHRTRHKNNSKQHRWRSLGIVNIDGTVFTLMNYKELLKFQKDRCAICKKSSKNNRQQLSVDHDHKTGIVRGLLCTVCNTKLGYFEDKKFHTKATQYLIR